MGVSIRGVRTAESSQREDHRQDKSKRDAPVESHPCAKDAQGWGTLEKIMGQQIPMRMRPRNSTLAQKDAQGWGILADIYELTARNLCWGQFQAGYVPGDVVGGVVGCEDCGFVGGEG